MKRTQRIGILGGTFDPIHNAHLRLAVEFREAIDGTDCDSRVHLIPCHIPPHRDQPLATAQQRLTMLRLALDDSAGFYIDTRELQSDTPSFSFDTLVSLHNELPDAHLILAVGEDAFAGFCRWHRWQEILEMASIVVAARPGSTIVSKAESTLLAQRQVALDDLDTVGQIAWLEMTSLSISSSLIRQLIAEGKSLDFLLPDVVANYIADHALYRQR